MTQENASFDVFLSHNSQDKPAVETLARRLEDETGLKPWLDKWNLVPGDPWQEAIEEALDRSRTCVVFLGPGGFGGWHHEEMRSALDQRVSQRARKFRIIPVLLPGSVMPERSKLPAFLSRLTWVDFRAGLDDSDAFHRLVAGIRGMVPGRRDDSATPVAFECPYRGLEAFDEIHARYFFGREAMTQHLVEALRQTRFLAVLGASGSGKSSLARAGLLPMLKAGALPGSEHWKYLKFKPGAHPLETLATHLAAENLSVNPITELYKSLVDAENALHLQVRLGLIRHFPDEKEREQARCLILVDQFEEIFTLCQQEPERLRFIDNLRYAGFVEAGQTVIVMTMRADFLAQAARYTPLAEMVSDHQFLVSPLDEADTRRVIEAPAQAVGLRFEDGLIERIQRDFGDEPGALPLLEDALLQLFEHRKGGVLTQREYDGTGGVQGALAKRADDLYRDFTLEQQEIARRILLRLTQPGEGTADTRRRASRNELWTRAEERPIAEEVIEALTKARLITLSREPELGEQVDVAHEALIRGWPRLGQWINDDRAGLRLHRRLTEAAMEWQREHPSEDFLYRGARLAQAVEWREANESSLNDLERAFLDSSIACEKRVEDQEKERQRRRRIGLSVLALFSVLIAFLMTGLWQRAYQEREKAEAQRQRAIGEKLAAEAQFVESRHPSWLSLGMLLGTESLKILPSLVADQVLRHGLELMPKPLAAMAHESAVNAVAFSPDGKTLATASGDHTVRLWEAASGKELQRLTHEGGINALAFSPDGKFLATASGNVFINKDFTARLWEAATGKELQRINHADRVNAVAFSPNGKFLATASGDRTAQLWEAASGTKLQGLNHESEVNAVAFSPDGKALATASGDIRNSKDNTARLWETASGKELQRLNHEDRVNTLAFSPNGKFLATASGNILFSRDTTARLWEATTGKELQRLNHAEGVNAVAFNPDGKTLATASKDGTARLWEAETGKELQRLNHESAVNALAFSPDGKTLATASENRTARLWEAESGKELQRLNHESKVNAVAFSPDGKTLATASGSIVNSKDNTARLWVWQPRDLITQSCGRLTRNLSSEEWRQYFEDELYRKTCENLPVHPTVYQAAQTLAGENKIAEATALLERVKAIEPVFRQHPEAIAQILRADKRLRDKQFKEAVAGYREADKLDGNLLQANHWNGFCWIGALQGHAADVMESCERAVVRAAEDKIWVYRDSRGLARALTGDYPGAIEDFEVFIRNIDNEVLKKQRQAWVEALRVGKNPFSKEVLEELQRQ